MKSHFENDLSKEQQLFPLLDRYYSNYLRHSSIERIVDKKQQLQGIDLVLLDNRTGASYMVDEKAQLDYLNECLPTFAFELYYQKGGEQKLGWLFDPSKKTEFYALVTSIYADEKDAFTSCNITFVNRHKLLHHLAKLGLTHKFLGELTMVHKKFHGKLELKELDAKTEGYLYFSTRNKAEKPINLILRLDYLIALGVAKRLV